MPFFTILEPSRGRLQGPTTLLIIPEAAVPGMVVLTGAIPLSDGTWALVRALDRDDLVGLAVALPSLWLLLTAADWKAVFSF